MVLKRRKAVARWVERPPLDLVLSLPGFTLVLVPKAAEKADTVAGAVATVASILLGLVGVVVTLYQAGEGTRMRRLRALTGVSSRRNWMSILRGMLIVAFGALVSLAFVSWVPSVVLAFCGYATLFMTWRAMRLVWLTSTYLEMSDHDVIDKAGGLPAREDLGVR